jgi:uncharacterized Zn-binding protein involved in type VI secretion
MSKFTARIGDQGKGDCLNGHSDIKRGERKPFTTTFVTGSDNVFVNYRPVVRIGDIGDTDCGHETKAATGSGTVYVNNRFVHRLGDIGKVLDDGDTYEVITGSSDVLIGD